MPRDANGNYTLPQSPFVPNTTISSTAVNSDLSDIASTLTGSVAANGVTPIIGQLRATEGVVPSYSFVTDLTTGFGASGSGVPYIAAAGVQVLVGSATGVTVNGTLTTTGILSAGAAIKASDGTVALPAISFTSSPASGFYVIGVNDFGFAVNGVKILEVTSAGFSINGSFTFSGGLTITSGGAAITGDSTVTGNLTSTGILSGATAAGAMLASQAQMEAASASNVLVTPARVQSHPAVPKAWGYFNTGGLITGYNCTSAVHIAQGRWTITLTTPFSSINYAIFLQAQYTGATMTRVENGTQGASSFNAAFSDSSGTLVDVTACYFACFGDQ